MSKYKDCTVLTMPQRTDAWFAARKGNLTASDFGDWLTKTTTTAKKSELTAICKVVAGHFDCEEAPRYENWAMTRGIALEPAALAMFSSHEKCLVEEAGFCQSNKGNFGCSPDGLLPFLNSGVELKCPLPATHAKYLLSGELPPEYKAQVHGSMAVTGADSWYFASFCPNLPLFVIKVERDEFTEAMLKGLIKFSANLDKAIADITAMYNVEF